MGAEYKPVAGGSEEGAVVAAHGAIRARLGRAGDSAAPRLDRILGDDDGRPASLSEAIFESTRE